MVGSWANLVENGPERALTLGTCASATATCSGSTHVLLITLASSVRFKGIVSSVSRRVALRVPGRSRLDRRTR
jgi:hypothetical protein